MDAEKFKLLSVELETVAGLLPAHSESAGGYYSKEYLVLAGFDGTGNPVFTNDDIRFNGDSIKGLDHETFYISQDNTKHANAMGSKGGLISEFIKTNRKPYDLMVKISMLRLKHHFPESKISCDGEAPDWKHAKEIYKKAFGGRMPKIN